MKVSGMDDALKGINDAISKYAAAAVKGVEDVALDLVGLAVRDAPVDEGDLRGSGTAEVDGTLIAKGNSSGNITVTGRASAGANPVAKVGFGVPYALRQDQDRTYNHPRGGKAGYLSDNTRENSGRYARHIENEVRKGGA